MNVRELKARLSAYLREAQRGETFLVTDRSTVVAQLGPAALAERTGPGGDVIARLVALGARPPLRGPRPTDYRRTGPGSGLPVDRIDALLDATREDAR